MIIRAYTPDDLEQVVDVFFRSVRDTASADYTAQQRAAWAPASPDLAAWSGRLSSGGVFVCEHAGRVVGFSRIDPEGGIDLLFVAPTFQRQGVARALLERMLSWSSAHELKANVSLTARPFFEQQGFGVVAVQETRRGGETLRYFEMRLVR